MKRVRVECPRCGMKLLAPDLQAELAKAKAELAKLWSSVASNLIRVSRRIAKLRKGSCE